MVSFDMASEYPALALQVVGIEGDQARRVLVSIWEADEPYTVLEDWAYGRHRAMRTRAGGYESEARLEADLLINLMTFARHASGRSPLRGDRPT